MTFVDEVWRRRHTNAHFFFTPLHSGGDKDGSFDKSAIFSRNVRRRRRTHHERQRNRLDLPAAVTRLLDPFKTSRKFQKTQTPSLSFFCTQNSPFSSWDDDGIRQTCKSTFFVLANSVLSQVGRSLSGSY